MASERKAQQDESVKAASEVGADEVQQKMDEANEQGFFGTSPDETPRENYTLGGVAAGKPTPETDDSRIK